MSLAMRRRSFHEHRLRPCRIRCTMQVCTWVSGKTLRIASGNPFRPSMTAIRMSCRPRLRSSFITRSQNLAPSFCSIHSPSTSLLPSLRMPRARCTALLRTVPSSRIRTRMASRKTTG